MRTLLASFLVLAACLAFLWLAFQGDRGEEARVVGSTRAPAPSRDPLAPARSAGTDPARSLSVEVDAPNRAADGSATATREEDRVPFRGRVLDAATEESIPWIEVQAGAFRTETDAAGRFRSPTSTAIHFAPETEATVRDPRSRTVLGVLRIEDAERRSADGRDELLLRVPYGPTYPVQIAGTAGVGGWRARLVEHASDGTVHSGRFFDLFAPPDGGPWLLRTERPWEPNLPGSTFVIEARNLEENGRSDPLRSAVGVYPEVVPITPSRTIGSLQGWVVDTAGEPQKGARVSAVPLGVELADARFQTSTSGGGGLFLIRDLPTGSYRLHVQGRRGQPPVEVDWKVEPGFQEVGDIAIEPHVPAGRIEGRLANRSGAALEGPLRVRLRAIDGRPFELLDVTHPAGMQIFSSTAVTGEEDRQDGQVFEFASVPAGTYELSVLPHAGIPWTPETLVVSPPNTEVLFVREDERALYQHAFEVFGEHVPQGSYALQIHFDGAFSPELCAGDPRFLAPRDARFTWSLRARGFQAAHGDESAFRTTGGRRVARVQLRPGWGGRLFLRDLGGGLLHDDDAAGSYSVVLRPGIPNARVFADGEEVAVSDASGLVTLALEERPEEIRIEADGWRQVASGKLRDGRLTGSEVDVVVWFVRN